MREIKFRVWDCIDRYWLDPHHFYMAGDGILRSCQSCKYNITTTYETLNRDRYILEQYTGLHDKNGKEGYGSDILGFSVFDMNDADIQYIGVIKFCEGEWQVWNPKTENGSYGSDGPYSLYWILSQDDEAEIIGNIHTTPELLEVK